MAELSVGRALTPTACSDCEFESRQGHGCLSHVIVVRCQVVCFRPVARPTESYRLWCVTEYDLETSRKRRPFAQVGLLRLRKRGRERVKNVTPYLCRRECFLYFKELHKYGAYHESLSQTVFTVSFSLLIPSCFFRRILIQGRNFLVAWKWLIKCKHWLL
jgi:hypothetical protein